MIDYSLAAPYSDYVHAICIAETDGVEWPQPPPGDGSQDDGQATGICQMHPADFWQYYGRSLRFPRSVSHTWTEAFIVTCASFFDIELVTLRKLDLVVQAWNLGVTAVLKGKRDPDYLARFDAALNKIKGSI